MSLFSTLRPDCGKTEGQIEKPKTFLELSQKTVLGTTLKNPDFQNCFFGAQNEEGVPLLRFEQKKSKV